MNRLKLLLRMVILLLVQVLVFNHIHFLGYATPVITAALLLYFPQSASRSELLVWSFVLGVVVDAFSNTPGVCAGSMTFVAMVYPYLLDLQIPKDEDEDIVPTFRSMGRWSHVRLIFSLLFVHLLVYFALDAFSFYHLTDTAASFACSLLLSFVVLLLLDSYRKGR